MQIRTLFVLKDGQETLVKGVLIGEAEQLFFMERLINDDGHFRAHIMTIENESHPATDMFARLQE